MTCHSIETSSVAGRE